MSHTSRIAQTEACSEICRLLCLSLSPPFTSLHCTPSHTLPSPSHCHLTTRPTVVDPFSHLQPLPLSLLSISVTIIYSLPHRDDWLAVASLSPLSPRTHLLYQSNHMGRRCCALSGCSKRTDQRRRFGRVRPVTLHDSIVHRLRFKAHHDGVLCNGCWQVLYPPQCRPLIAIAVAPPPPVDMGDAAADLLSLLKGPSSLSASPSPSVALVPVTQPITRAVSLPLQPMEVPTPPASSGRLTRTRSAPPCKRPHVDAATREGERVRVVLSHTIAGTTWTGYSMGCAATGVHFMSEVTWHKHLQRVLTAAKMAWSQIAAEYVESLVKKGQPVVVAADGAWSHRHDANQHEFTMMNAEDEKVIASIAVMRHRFRKGKEVAGTGNYYGTSKHMEAVGMVCVENRGTHMCTLSG